MSEEMEGLAARLVVGRKRDGRAVYEEQAKAELVAMCAMPGASVSRLARECGINANQLSRWIRESTEARQLTQVKPAQPSHVEAFVPVIVNSSMPAPTPRTHGHVLQARLPNGVVIELHDLDAARTGEIIEALGRLRCSASTKG